MTLDSIHKAEKMDIQQILLPHYGVVSGEEAQYYLTHGEEVAQQISNVILAQLNLGKTTEEILEYVTDIFYTEQVRPTYPYAAFLMNSEIMINLIRKELFSGIEK